MDNIEKSRKRLTEYLSRTGQTQAAVSRRISLSTATISQFLSSSYTGDNEEVAMKIGSFLDLQEMREDYIDAPAFTDQLRNTRKINIALDYVFANRCMGVVAGVSGCGKTTALKNYQKIMNGVVYIQADATKWSPCSILKLILKSMGTSYKGSASDILDKLVEEFSGTDKLIIIDEAQHLKPKAFDTLRALNDRAEVGVVYAGTPDIINRMIGGRKKEDFDQVYSRIGYTCHLQNRFSENEIAALFAEFNLDKMVIKYLCEIASKKGGLRYMVSLFKVGAAKTDGALTIEALEAAAHHVGVGVMHRIECEKEAAVTAITTTPKV